MLSFTNNSGNYQSVVNGCSSLVSSCYRASRSCIASSARTLWQPVSRTWRSLPEPIRETVKITASAAAASAMGAEGFAKSMLLTFGTYVETGDLADRLSGPERRRDTSSSEGTRNQRGCFSRTIRNARSAYYTLSRRTRTSLEVVASVVATSMMAPPNFAVTTARQAVKEAATFGVETTMFYALSTNTAERLRNSYNGWQSRLQTQLLRSAAGAGDSDEERSYSPVHRASSPSLLRQETRPLLDLDLSDDDEKHAITTVPFPKDTTRFLQSHIQNTRGSLPRSPLPSFNFDEKEAKTFSASTAYRPSSASGLFRRATTRYLTKTPHVSPASSYASPAGSSMRRRRVGTTISSRTPPTRVRSTFVPSTRVPTTLQRSQTTLSLTTRRGYSRLPLMASSGDEKHFTPPSP